MLWRQSYQTRVLRDLDCPDLSIASADGTPVTHERGVWICGFGFGCFTEQGVWARLFQSDFPRDPNVKKVFIFDSVGPEKFESLQALVAPSELENCLLIEDPQQAWRKLTEPDHLERGFTAIVEGQTIPLLMVGPPTEDAWEEFSDLWRTRT